MAEAFPPKLGKQIALYIEQALTTRTAQVFDDLLDEDKDFVKPTRYLQPHLVDTERPEDTEELVEGNGAKKGLNYVEHVQYAINTSPATTT